MPPLARPLLALALAALLRACCAHNKCSLDSIGKTFKGEQIILPHVTMKESGDFDIPNNCKDKNMVLQGELVLVCDWHRRPDVTITDGGATVRVARDESVVPGAKLFVGQYCKVPA